MNLGNSFFLRFYECLLVGVGWVKDIKKVFKCGEYKEFMDIVLFIWIRKCCVFIIMVLKFYLEVVKIFK